MNHDRRAQVDVWKLFAALRRGALSCELAKADNTSRDVSDIYVCSSLGLGGIDV